MTGLGLPEAPTFRPTEEEWASPLEYIYRVVRPAAEQQAGIAKIIPPPSFRPPFAIDRRTFRFRTRVQAVNELQEKAFNSLAVKRFWEDYTAFLQRRGQRHKKQPTYAGQEVDLYRLSRLVQRRGGYQVVTDDKAWREVAGALEVGLLPRCHSLPGPPGHPAPNPPPAGPPAAPGQGRQPGLLAEAALPEAAAALRGVLQDEGERPERPAGWVSGLGPALAMPDGPAIGPGGVWCAFMTVDAAPPGLHGWEWALTWVPWAGAAGAALDAELSESKSEGADEPREEIGEDEAAEILEAMLGMAPAAAPEPPPKKKQRKGDKVRAFASGGSECATGALVLSCACACQVLAVGPGDGVAPSGVCYCCDAALHG